MGVSVGSGVGSGAAVGAVVGFGDAVGVVVGIGVATELMALIVPPCGADARGLSTLAQAVTQVSIPTVTANITALVLRIIAPFLL